MKRLAALIAMLVGLAAGAAGETSGTMLLRFESFPHPMDDGTTGPMTNPLWPVYMASMMAEGAGLREEFWEGFVTGVRSRRLRM